MLSLDRLQAFSVKKGCYPGQEIVARTHFLGQAKARAHAVRMPRANPEAGANVDVGAVPLGQIVSTARKRRRLGGARGVAGRAPTDARR